MKRFARLLDRLAFTPQRTGKLRLLTDYFRTTPDPDRGLALAALTDGLPFSLPVRRSLVELMERRLDPELYRLSRDYVGDTAETVALLWPESETQPGFSPLRLADVVAELEVIDRNRLTTALETWLDQLDATERWALLKLLTGALRVGVSARLAKTALAEMSGESIDAIEEIWHGQRPPYTALFAWLGGEGERPDVIGHPGLPADDAGASPRGRRLGGLGPRRLRRGMEMGRHPRADRSRRRRGPVVLPYGRRHRPELSGAGRGVSLRCRS